MPIRVPLYELINWLIKRTAYKLFDLFAECQSIVPNCAKCLDSFRCRKCRSDLHAFFNKSGMVCVRNCPRGLVAANSSYFGKYCKKPLVGKNVKGWHSIVSTRRCQKINLISIIEHKIHIEVGVATVGGCENNHVPLACLKDSYLLWW